MAVAGRVAIVPKGDYNPETVYKKLDLVRYGLDAYVARKASTGEIPYPEDKEFWMLMVSGQEGIAEKITYDNTLSGLTAEDVQSALDELANMLKEKYVKKTDYAVAATEDSPGIPGIVQPDGKTIKVSENGILTGASIGFTGTRAEYLEAVENGEIEPGMTVFITDDFTAPEGSKIRIGEKDEIKAAVEAGEIEDGTIVLITDDYVEPAVVTPEEIQEVKEQASNAVETASAAVPDISGNFNAKTVGWYRLFKIDEFSSCFDFDLNLLRNYNTGAAGDCLKAHINMVYSVPTYKVAFDQISSRQRGFYLRQVRVVEDRREGTSKGIYIDVKYNASTLNRVYAKIQNYNMTEGKVWPQFIGEFVNDEEENEKLTYHIFEPVNTVGTIADRAISDGEGNNIPETYQTKSIPLYEAPTAADFDSAINNEFSKLTNSSTSKFIIHVGSVYSGLSIGYYDVTLTRIEDGKATLHMICVQEENNTPIVVIRSRNKVWGSFKFVQFA